MVGKLGKVIDSIMGPKRVFVVKSIETGNPYLKTYSGISFSGVWGIGDASPYSYDVEVKPVTATITERGSDYREETLQNTGYGIIMSGVNLLPREQEVLRQSIGQSVSMRAKEPYDSGTLKKLAKARGGV